MDFRFVNLTPHAIHLNDLEIPASGKVVRVEETVENIQPGFQRFTQNISSIQAQLPEQKYGTFLIVSEMVLRHCNHRGDVVSPGEVIRDENGRVIGCRTFRVTDSFESFWAWTKVKGGG